MNKLDASITQFEKALARLKEAVSLPKSDIVRDSAIQRFEFTLDLAWKSLKAFIEDKKGVVCASPKDCFREAYRQGIIQYSEKWLEFVDMRNETSHTYKEEIAERVYGNLSGTIEYFDGLLVAIKK